MVEKKAEHGYETGRLNLPFVGHCTFGKQPPCLDWNAINADVAVVGIPYDMGTQYRAGARFGPRAIREASTLFSFGHNGAYDHEDDVVYLPGGKVRIIDVGDADIVHTDTMASLGNAEAAIRVILKAGALPVALGGDHSVHAACIKAFDSEPPVHIVHFDAHLDFVDQRHGVRYGHGSPLRRASEMKHVHGITHLGIRGVSSSNKSDYDAARAFGSKILSVRQIRRLGTDATLEEIPVFPRSVLAETIGFGLASAFVSLLIGFPVGYSLARLPPEKRRSRLIAVILPLTLSLVVVVFGWLVVLGRNGLLNSLLIGFGLIDRPHQLLFNRTAVLVVLVQQFLPFMILSVMSVVAQINPVLEQAAANLRANRFTTFRRVVLPLAMPGILSGLTLVFILTASAFITPRLIGGPRIQMIGSLIYQQVMTILNWPFAAAMAFILLIITLAVTWVANATLAVRLDSEKSGHAN